MPPVPPPLVPLPLPFRETLHRCRYCGAKVNKHYAFCSTACAAAWAWERGSKTTEGKKQP